MAEDEYDCMVDGSGTYHYDYIFDTTGSTGNLDQFNGGYFKITSDSGDTYVYAYFLTGAYPMWPRNIRGSVSSIEATNMLAGVDDTILYISDYLVTENVTTTELPVFLGQTTIIVTDSTPTPLYYQCENHDYMEITIVDNVDALSHSDISYVKTLASILKSTNHLPQQVM